MNSKKKGNRGELELSKLLTSEGFPSRRGQQYSGSPDSPDVVCDSLPVHWECKRTERLNVYDAIDQARRDAGDKIPIVAHRRNDSRWLAILDLRDLLEILREYGPDAVYGLRSERRGSKRRSTIGAA